MAHQYVVTAQKPTQVTRSVVGNFTAAGERNLILAKLSRFELHSITPEGLQPVFDVGIYGRIEAMKLFRPARCNKDLLFLATHRYQACVLEFDADTKQLVTRSRVSLKDRVGRPVESGFITMMDPEARAIGMHLYCSVLKVIPVSPTGELGNVFNVRLDEPSVLDMVFLAGYSTPTFAVLYNDADNPASRHVKTYHIDLVDQSLRDGPWAQRNVESAASVLIPLPRPYAGVLIIGERTITYHSGTDTRSIAVPPMAVKSFGLMDADGSRILLGDQAGSLHLLMLQLDAVAHSIKGLVLERLGDTCIPSTVSYLDNRVVFIGGLFGDSLIAQLNDKKNPETNSYLEVMDTHANLGPIVDLCVVDTERNGRGVIVTCSGSSKDGSLRIVRNGIGIEEQAEVELPGIRGLWSLRATLDSVHDKFLVQSFYAETRVFSIVNEEMDETDIDGFDATRATLHCGNMVGDLLLQVTDDAARLVSLTAAKEVSVWRPPAGTRITVAASSATQVAVALSGGDLVYMEVDAGALAVRKQVHLEYEISCLSLDPVATGVEEAKGSDGDVDMTARTPQVASILAVGMWTDISVRLFRCPSLDEMTRQPLGGDIQARSVLMARLEGQAYLLVGLGDGHLFQFTLQPATGALSDRKKVSLGTQPVRLASFQTGGVQHVFAACDRPTVLYSSGGKLLFSSVNMSELTCMTALNTELFPDCLALATDAHLIVGTVDEIQKLHVRSVPLGEAPWRITYHASSKSVVVGTLSVSIGLDESENTTSSIRLFDDALYERVASYDLEKYEMVSSMLSCTFNGDAEKEYVVVGTAYVLETEDEPSSGRVLVFSVTGRDNDRSFVLEASHSCSGAVFAMDSFQGKLLISVNSKVELLRWEMVDDAYSLTTECDAHGHTLSLSLESRGNFVLVGDMMRSVSLLSYNAVDGSLETVAHEPSATWVSACGIENDDTFLAADNNFHFVTVAKTVEGAEDDEHVRLKTVGEYHFGDLVNRMRHGSMVMDPSNVADAADAGAAAPAAAVPIPRFVFGTVSGAIGVIVQLPTDLFLFLKRLQEAMTQVIVGVGGFVHAEWRGFEDDRRATPSAGYIDGDLIEMFLELDNAKMREVVKKLNDDGENDKAGGGPATVESVTKIVDDLARLH